MDRDTIETILARQRAKLDTKPLGLLHSKDQPTAPRIHPEFKLHEPEQRQGSYFPPLTKTIRVLGLDLGQAIDPAAAVMLHIRGQDPNYVGPPYPWIDIPWMHEWEIGYDYVELARNVLRIQRTVSLQDGKWDGRKKDWVGGTTAVINERPDYIVFDVGGVGRGFRDILLREAAKTEYPPERIKAVTLASSNASVRIHEDARGKIITIPKIEIVTAINIFEQAKILRFKCDTRRFFTEAATFRLKITAAARKVYDHKGADHHGDLCIAAGLACRYVQRGFRQLAMV